MVSNDIKNVFISDDVSEACVKILENNGLNVVKNTKLSPTELAAELLNFDCLVVRSATKVTQEMIEAGGKNLKLIARAGTGVDNIDVKAATKSGVLVMNAVGSNTLSAAELTCGLLMSLARHIPQANISMRAEKWERAKFMGSELYGKTLAVVGLGRIGREVASRMRAFGMKIIGYDPMMTASQAAEFNIEYHELKDLWPIADYITIHVPLMDETRNLINAQVLSQCKKGFRIVNCARGGIIEENDLLKSLESGHCAGAAIDTFADEPTKNFALVHHPNLIGLPHLGASTVEAQARVATDIAEQIVKFVKNNKVEGAVNPELLA